MRYAINMEEAPFTGTAANSDETSAAAASPNLEDGNNNDSSGPHHNESERDPGDPEECPTTCPSPTLCAPTNLTVHHNNNIHDINANSINHQLCNFSNHQQLINNNNWWDADARTGSAATTTTHGTSNMRAAGVGNDSPDATQSITLLPRAILRCRTNSHPFQTRTLTLIPNVEVKVGRAVARHPVSETNAIFDCKVLSRNHAVLWYSDDKFYIRDTGSSNGTFVNNQRLSQTCLQSDKFEICSGDIVQFGVDVIENARKETHGCIVATVRLYLPDGRETKASQLTGVSADNGNILSEDLYRLHQFIQEAMVREQMLEVKMNELQRLLELTKLNVDGNWQAMVDEDRLLNRIDILENKVQVFQKNVGEEKLREELRQLQDDKLDYQHAAKEALRRVYQDRYEAVQKLSAVEFALRNTEEEASLLRDRFIKSESTLNDTLTRLSTIQQKYEELQPKCRDLESKLKLFESMNNNVKPVAAGGDVNEMDRFAKLFANSDLNNLEGSADIINSIFNGNEEGQEYYEPEPTVQILKQVEVQKSVEPLSNDGVSKELKIYPKILGRLQALENVLRKLELSVDEDAEAKEYRCEVPDNRSINLTAFDENSKPRPKELLRDFVRQLKEIYNEMRDPLAESEIKLDKVEREDLGEDMSKVLEEKIVQLQKENENLVGTIELRPTVRELEAKEELVDHLQQELLSVKLKVSQLQDELNTSTINTLAAGNACEVGKDSEAPQNKLDIELVTDPMVEVEEELVIYKEKFLSLSEINIGLQTEIEALQKKCSVAQSLMNITMYMGPIIFAIVCYLIFWSN